MKEAYAMPYRNFYKRRESENSHGHRLNKALNVSVLK